MRLMNRTILPLLLLAGILVIIVPEQSIAQRQTFTQELVLDDDQNLPTPATITLRTPPNGAPGFASYTLTLPESPPAAQSVLTSNAAGQLEWVATVPQAGGWLLNGNTGTVPGTDFLGTTDNVALQIHVNNLAATPLPNEGNGRVMRFEPQTLSPNIIGGFKNNSVTAGAEGIVIGGGGSNGALNQVTNANADFAVILGGSNNQVSATHGTIVGGFNNRVSGDTGTAMGNNTQAIGDVSTAMGSGTRARGVASLAAGQSTQTGASAAAAVALGQSTQANGIASMAVGLSSIAGGDAAFAAGQSTQANGTASFAMGLQSDATANSSIVLGQWVNATAANAITIGKGVSNGSRLVNNVANSLMVGFNQTTPSLYVGPNSGNADNRGNVGIGMSTPASRLVVRAEDIDSSKSVLNVTDNAGTSALFVKNDARVGIGGVTSPGTSATNLARVHIAGLTNGVFGVGRPVSFALVVNNAVGDPLLRIRDDGRMQLRTANAAFSGLTTRGSIGPALDNTYDLGSCELQWRDIFVGNNLIFDCVPGTPDLNSAEMSYDQTNAYLDLRVTDGTNAPTTAMVVAEQNRRVGLTDGTGTAFSATGPQGALDIRSTTGALIIPRMTFAQRTAGGFPTVDGSMVYQTDDDPTATCPGNPGCEGFYFYENGAWVRK